MNSHFIVSSLLALLQSAPSECFSAASRSRIDRIKSVIDDTIPPNNAITIPLEKILSVDDQISYSSDLAPPQDITVSSYAKLAQARHADCLKVFDGYEAKVTRCEVLDERSLNVRWEASWMPAGSTWLYDLADAAGWGVTRRSPDSCTIATFSWKFVSDTFGKAFATGNITLPIASVKGNIVVSISELEGSTGEDIDHCISLKESIDLVSDADRGRLQNRRVAQELASWIDVSRRPYEGIDADEWAGIVRQRVLSGVAGTGALDVDPNEVDSEPGIALFIFGVVCLGALALSFEYFTSGTGKIPAKCDDAAIFEFGSGYLSECFGPFGDPLY